MRSTVLALGALSLLSSFAVCSARDAGASALDQLADAAGRLRRLHKSDSSDVAEDDSGTGTGSSSSSDTHTFADHDLACYLFDNAFQSVFDNGGLTPTSDSCTMCWQQCGLFNSTVCPETCTSVADIEDFCSDAEDETVASATGTGGTGGTGSSSSKSKSKDHDGLCHMQCLEYASRCCPCGTETCLVDYSSSQQISTTADDVLAPILAAEGTGAFPTDNARRNLGTEACTNEFDATTAFSTAGFAVQPGDRFCTTTGTDVSTSAGLYGGSTAITGTIAADAGAIMGMLDSRGVGLLFGALDTAGAIGDEGCATVMFPQEYFLHGNGGCGTQITKIEYMVDVTDTTVLGDTKIRLILQDSRGTHVSDTIGVADGASGKLDVTTLDWSEFDIRTNSDSHHAGTVGGTSAPSFNCAEYVGAMLCGEVTAAITAGAPDGVLLSKFKVYGKDPILTA